jgi:hypothetical protein
MREHSSRLAVGSRVPASIEWPTGIEIPLAAGQPSRISAPVIPRVLPARRAIDCFLPLRSADWKFPCTSPLDPHLRHYEPLQIQAAARRDPERRLTDLIGRIADPLEKYGDRRRRFVFPQIVK